MAFEEFLWSMIEIAFYSDCPNTLLDKTVGDDDNVVVVVVHGELVFVGNL